MDRNALRANDACARFLRRRVRNAALMLTAIFLLQLTTFAPSADAHADAISGHIYATDNLLRWGIHNVAYTIDAEIEEGVACPNEPDPWRVNVGEDPVCPASSRDVTLNARLQRLASLASGWPGTTGGVTMFDATSSDHASRGTNRSMMNITFTHASHLEVPLTHIKFTPFVGVNPALGGAGNYLFWVKLRNNADAVIKEFQIGTIPCTRSNSQDDSFSTSFSRILFHKIELWIDYTACEFTGDSLNVGMHQLMLYSQGNREDALTYVHKFLEYGDFIRGREGTSTMAQGGQLNVTAQLSQTAMNQGRWFALLSPGENFVITSGTCTVSCSSGFEAIWPAGFIPWGRTDISPGGCISQGGSGYSIEYVGPSHASSSMNHVWRIESGCTTYATLNFAGFMGSSGTIDFFTVSNASDKIHFGNTYPDGGTFTSNHAAPSVAFCHQCTSTSDFEYHAFAAVYPTSRGPLVTTPYAQAFDLDANFDLTSMAGVTTTPAIQTNTAITNISVTIPQSMDRFGNAYWLTLVAYNTTATPNFCPTTTTIDGVKNLQNVVVRNTRGQAEGLGFGQACFILVEDFTRTLAIATDAQGNNRYLNTPGSSVTHTVQIAWPTTALPPHGPGSNGYPVRTIQTIGGKHAERIACTSNNNICFGNLDTNPLPLANAVSNTTFFWSILDGTNKTNGAATPAVNGSRVFESITGQIGVSNGTLAQQPLTGDPGTTVTANLVMNITTPNPRFSITKLGYQNVFFNLTNVTTPNVWVTVYMSRNVSDATQSADCTLAGNMLACSIILRPDAGIQCDSLDASANRCENALARSNRVWLFYCPVDAGTTARAFINGTHVIEYQSRFTTTVPNLSPANTPCGQNAYDAISGANPPTTGSFTFHDPGNEYRAINFTNTNLSAEAIHFQPHMKKGAGYASSVTVIYYNGTAIHPVSGRSATYTFIYIIDAADPSATAAQLAGASEAIDVSLSNMGAGLGFTGGAKNAWGLIIWLIIMGVFLALYWWAGAIPGANSSAMFGVASFFAVGAMGLFDAWLMIAVVLVVVAFLALAFNRS